MLLFATGSGYGKQILTTEEVSEKCNRNAILWDVRDFQAYSKGHIPCAINIGKENKKICLILRSPRIFDYIPTDQIHRYLSEWGIDPSKEIVIYGEKASVCPYFVAVTLKFVGYENVKVYHGGIDDWISSGKTISTHPISLPPVKLPLKVNPKPDFIVSTDYILRNLGKTDIQILDVRTQREYIGEDIRAIRGGNIPGSINIPYEMNWVDPYILYKSKDKTKIQWGLSLKPLEELKKIYNQLDPNKKTIIYCQTGPRACVTAIILEDLGFRSVGIYDSSWFGYANRLGAPVDNEGFFDVFFIMRKLKEIEQRLKILENEIKE